MNTKYRKPPVISPRLIRKLTSGVVRKKYKFTVCIGSALENHPVV